MRLEEFVKAGCDIITVHVEACTHLHRTIQNIKSHGIKAGVVLNLHRTIQNIKSHGIKAGVVLNPATSLDTIKYVLDDVDMVLLMSVNPGFGGQSYIPCVTEKIRELRKMIDERGLNVEIEVDGGVKPSNIKEVVEAGADVCVAGSAIFGKDDIDAAVKDLRESAK